MVDKPGGEAVECSHYAGVKILRVAGRRPGALVGNVVAQPLDCSFALEGICK
jgi:hypothetical protein